MLKKRIPFALLVITPVVLISFCGCGVNSPGQALNWSSPAAASVSSPSASIAVATAPATPVPPDAGLSWSAIWSNLNQNTGQVASGQYALLQLFEGALKSQVDGRLARSN